MLLSQICVAAGAKSFSSKHYTSQHSAHFCCFIVLVLFIYSSGAVGLLWKEPNLSRSKSTSLRFPTSSLFKKELHSCTCGSEGKLKWNVDSSPGCSQSNSDLRPKNSYDGKHTFIAALINILSHTPSRTHSPRLRWTDGTLKICIVFVFMWVFFFHLFARERDQTQLDESSPLRCSGKRNPTRSSRIREPLAV